MNTLREHILRAYAKFYPASSNIIARIEHLNHHASFHDTCVELHEEGLLVKTLTSNNIVEYTLSDIGQSMVSLDDVTSIVSSTKSTVFNNLKIKEYAIHELRRKIMEHMKSTLRFYSIHQLVLVSEETSLPIISSVLFGLLYEGLIIQCGPLYGSLIPISSSSMVISNNENCQLPGSTS